MLNECTRTNGDISNSFGDISNSIADICKWTLFGDICNSQIIVWLQRHAVFWLFGRIDWQEPTNFSASIEILIRVRFAIVARSRSIAVSILPPWFNIRETSSPVEEIRSSVADTELADTLAREFKDAIILNPGTLLLNYRYLQIVLFVDLQLNCRYLQLNWRYLQINCRYLQILSIWRYTCISNWIVDIFNWIVDICNWIVDICNSIGYICKSIADMQFSEYMWTRHAIDIPLVDEKLTKVQAGFRPGRSCASQLLNLTQPIQDGYERKMLTCAAFVGQLQTTQFNTVISMPGDSRPPQQSPLRCTAKSQEEPIHGGARRTDCHN